jgi:hypothetical protein
LGLAGRQSSRVASRRMGGQSPFSSDDMSSPSNNNNGSGDEGGSERKKKKHGSVSDWTVKRHVDINISCSLHLVMVYRGLKN